MTNLHPWAAKLKNLCATFGLVLDMEMLVRLSDLLKQYIVVSPERTFKTGEEGELIRRREVFAPQVKSVPGVVEATAAMLPIRNGRNNHIETMGIKDAVCDKQPDNGFGLDSEKSDASFESDHISMVLLSHNDYKFL